MKSKLVTKQEMVTVYTCEVCGKESETPHIITSCEYRHLVEANQAACDHEFGYEFLRCDCDCDNCFPGVKKYCDKCDLVERLWFQTVSPPAVELLFNYMKKIAKDG